MLLTTAVLSYYYHHHHHQQLTFIFFSLIVKVITLCRLLIFHQDEIVFVIDEPKA